MTLARPHPAELDLGNSALADSEVSSYGRLRDAYGQQRTNHDNIRLGKFGVVGCGTTWVSSRIPTVPVVFEAGSPAQIVQPVVGSIKVHVVGLFTFGGGSVEGFKYGAMNVLRTLFPAIMGSLKDSVASRVPNGLQNASESLRDRFHGTDSTVVGNFVVPFVADNRKPSFCGRILLSHRRLLEGAWSELRQAFARPAARFVSEEFYHA